MNDINIIKQMNDIKDKTESLNRSTEQVDNNTVVTLEGQAELYDTMTELNNNILILLSAIADLYEINQS